MAKEAAKSERGVLANVFICLRKMANDSGDNIITRLLLLLSFKHPIHSIKVHCIISSHQTHTESNHENSDHSFLQFIIHVIYKLI